MSNYNNQGKFKAQGKRQNASNNQDSERDQQYGSRPSTKQSSGYDRDEKFGYTKNQSRYGGPKTSDQYGGQQQQRNYRDQENQDQRQDRPRTGYQDNGGYKQGYQNQSRPQTSFGGQPKASRYNDTNHGGQYEETKNYRRNPEKSFDGGHPSDGSQKDYPAKTQQRPGQSNFSQRPTAQKTSQALVPSHGGTVKVVSNQYQLKLGESAVVYQYMLDIHGMEVWDASLVHQIMKARRREIDMALGLNVCSGQQIYTVTELDEDISFGMIHKSKKYTVLIRKDTQCQVRLSQQFNNSDNSVTQNLLNIIIKAAFRDTTLKQIGKAPRFFDVSNPIKDAGQGLMIWQGFKASAFQSQVGCTLVMDSIFKFMSTQTCLDRIIQLKQNTQSSTMFQQQVRAEFQGKSIIADWGNKRTYYVDDIDFDSNPVKLMFESNGRSTTLAEYFQATYQKRITQKSQPLFICKMGENRMHLPTEFCLIDGVPDSMRKGPEMRNAMAKTRIRPEEKMQRIKKMVNELFSQKAVKDWDLTIESAPVTMDTNVLEAPQLIKGNQLIRCDEEALRKLPIQKAVNLKKEEWVFVYDKRQYDCANNIIENFQKACGQLKLAVEDPYFIELTDERDRAQLEEELQYYMMGERGQTFRHPKVVVCLLRQENNYTMVKEVMHHFRLPSQVITTRNAFKFNLSKATNILRQINSKVGGDLYTLQFPKKMQSMRPMLIGIDVCHAGPQSIVGFSASINSDLSQYFSDYLIQAKGQEIVQKKMIESIKAAIKAFAEHHRGEFPTNFIIYRDGVGDAQRDQVLSIEIPQFQKAIGDLYNKAAVKPEITVIVVNKRISQRFFVLDAQGRPQNPPSGCIIDKQLVEKQDSASSKKFDFFMTPASANQGCVLPTHFFVPQNDSDLTRIEIEQLTFALCHFYFNWAGPIKVPAPCQYAHKIAEFYMNIGANKRRQPAPCSQQQAKSEVERRVEPLNTKLHFL